MTAQATYSLIWNRLHRPGEQLIQIRVYLPNGKHKYISTGVQIPQTKWDSVNKQVINDVFAARLNNKIAEKMNKLRECEIRCNDMGNVVTSDDIDAALSGKTNSSSFMEFALRELDGMEIAGAVRYLHKRALKNAKSVGITRFSDLTYNNIDKFDKLVKKTLAAQTSVYKQHAVLKTYIRIAQKRGLMDGMRSPYTTFDVPKGKHKIRTRLDDSEITKMQKAELTDPEHIVCRDMYMFQVYTGVSYKDLCALTDANIRDNEDGMWIEGLRKKNGEYYTAYMIPEAVEIWKRYGGKKLAAHPDYTQNRLLKVVAGLAGINKKITCHSGRHSAASWMIRRGIPIGVIQQILGHSDIETTLVYAKLERTTIKDEMRKLTFAVQQP